MEEVKNYLQTLLNDSSEKSKSSELLFYEKVVDADLFRNGEEPKVSPSDFFLALYHLKNDESFISSSFFVENLIQQHFFDSDGKPMFYFLKLFENTNEKQFQDISFLLYSNMKPFWYELCHTITIIKTLFSVGYQKLQWFLLLIEKGPKNINLCNFLEFYKEHQEEYKDLFISYSAYAFLFDVMQKDKNMNWTSFYDEYRLKLMESYNLILNHKNSLEKKFKLSLKEERILKKLYEQRLSTLENVSENVYLSLTDEELKYYPNLLLKMLEEKFLVHNEKLLHQMEKNIEEHSKNRKKQIQGILKEYQISYSCSELELLCNSSFSISLFKTRLLAYMKWGISLSFPSFLFLFEVSDSVFEFFCFAMEQQLFTPHYLEKHIFDFTEETIELVRKNVEILKSFKYSVSSLDAVLFSSSELLERRIKLASCYQVSVDATFLMQDYFFDILDIWIELGIYSYFDAHKELLQNDFLNITKRILVAFQLSLPIFNEQGFLLSSFLEEGKFFLINEQLDGVISNVSSYFLLEEQKNKLDNSLRDEICLDSKLDDKYKLSLLEYCVDGKIFSRMRVLRNYYVLDDVFSAFFYGSILSLEECEKYKRIFLMENSISLKFQQ